MRLRKLHSVLDVRYWHLADNPVAPAFVRYWTKADKTRFWPKMACPLMPSRPGVFHPEPLTDPDLTLSRHPARAIARRPPPSIFHRVPPAAGSERVNDFETAQCGI